MDEARKIIRDADSAKRAARRAIKALQPKRERFVPTAVGQRRPRAKDPGYLAFLRRLPCVAGLFEGGCSGPVCAAHIRFSVAGKSRNPGLGTKNHDRHATSLCDHHHIRDQHAGNEKAFWARLGVDPYDLSAALYAAYLAGEDGMAALRRFIPSRTA